MSPPLFLHDQLDGVAAGDRVELTGPEGRHAATVRRVGVGEQLDLTDGSGLRVRARVREVGADRLTLEALSVTVDPESAPRLVLVQALAKGDRGELACELATEVGVDEIVPWAAQRCIVRWEGARGEKALARWRSSAREAAKQSRRARHPVLADPVTTGVLLDRVQAAQCFVLHERATEALATVALPAVGDVLLVVGPEGGITDAELGELHAAGATAVRLGASILRTSTAGAAAAAVVSARTARWA